MMNPNARPSLREQALKTALQNRVLVLDGAMGTAIQALDLNASAFGGDEFDGCNEYLTLLSPQIIENIHRSYLEAGCDIIETNTFGATPLVLAEYGLESKTLEVNREAARIARKAAESLSSPEKPRFVAGSMGPTTKAISVTGGVTFQELQEHYQVQAQGLIEGGVDYLLLETCQDTRNVKAGLIGIHQAFEKARIQLPIAISGTIEAMGTLLAGQSIEAFLASVSHVDLLYIGLNCATGPEFMTDHLRALSEKSPFPIACVPNAGLPDESGLYLESAEMVSQIMERFLQEGWLNLMGGCCGTDQKHIRALHELSLRHSPRPLPPRFMGNSVLSGIECLELTEEMRPILVGERTNSIGSRKFKELIASEFFEEAAEIARHQVKSGAQVIDICLANPDRDETKDMRSFLEKVTRKVKVPLMIDSTDRNVIELSLTYCQGKSLINSINLENGEERFEEIAPLAKKYGAAVVVGTIDEDPHQGMALSRSRKLQIAERSYKILTERYGIPESDLYWDPLVFPCASGDPQYLGTALETVEGIRLLKKRFPRTKTVLGISNISFGLPPAGREILNSVFLYHCVQAGLDLAIVNTEKLERYAAISQEEKKMADAVLFEGTEKAIMDFTNHFRKQKPKSLKKWDEGLPLDERLSRAIIEGSQEGLESNLKEALQRCAPLQIINGPLMKGMDEVGRLFNSNQLIVAEVLQSAEAMKTAVRILEPFMEKHETSLRGTILLATVKGDVHDIGKNLVEIILSNNGFQVINLGIKVPPEQLIQAIREHEPDILGLSGLLVKSAQQMVVTASDLTFAGIQTPLLVGGAALTSSFVDRQIAPAYQGTVAYASDAMAGLDLAKTITQPEQFSRLKEELATQRSKNAPLLPRVDPSSDSIKVQTRSAEIPLLTELPMPPDLDRHILRDVPIELLWKYINPLMLYYRHLGISGASSRDLGKLELSGSGSEKALLTQKLRDHDPKALQIWEVVQEVKEDYRQTSLFQPRAVYQFFKACSEGNLLHLYDGRHTLLKAHPPAATFDFYRQSRAEGLCLSDYSHPLSLAQSSRLIDTVALFVVSVGQGIREKANQLRERGDYLRSHIIQAIAIESAEAYAEYLHQKIRQSWGFPDPLEMTMTQRFQAKYRGKRYSFGYPACPRLEDQALIWSLLKPKEIGVELTEGYMMDPEASVSAFVFHHPSATYFSVGRSGDAFNDQR